MHVPIKHNFSAIFERPTFKGKIDKIKTYASGIFKRKSDGTPDTEKVQQENGGLDTKFINKHKITLYSKPEDYMEIFLPFNKNPYTSRSKNIFLALNF